MSIRDSWDPLDMRHMRNQRCHDRARVESLWTAAREGTHVPSSDELLAGMPFFKDSLREDMLRFARDLNHRVSFETEHPEPLQFLKVLQASLGEPDVGILRSLDTALVNAWEQGWINEVRADRLRCRIYMAHLGDPDAADAIGHDVLRAAYSQDWHLRGRPDDLVWLALGWMGLASTRSRFCNLGPGQAIPSMAPVGDRVASIAYELELRVGRAVVEAHWSDRRGLSEQPSHREAD